jgi:hypothetical protein
MKLFTFVIALTMSAIAVAQNVGIGTLTPVARLHVADSGVVFTNNTSVLPSVFAPPPVQGKGIRMMWYPQKAAFRVGAIDDGPLIDAEAGSFSTNHWNKDSIGLLSFASGFNTRASGFGAFASGYLSTATGSGSFAMGISNTAIGYGSVALGDSTIASGHYSTALNERTRASGLYSLATGYRTTASGSGSTAMGGYIHTNNYPGSFAIGDMNSASTLSSTMAYQMTMRFAGGYRFHIDDSKVPLSIDMLGRIGIGNISPNYPLTFNTDLGDKIALWSVSPANYGFGVQNSLLQIHSDGPGSDIAFGYGSSESFGETMRIKGSGNLGIGTATPSARLHVKDSSVLFASPGEASLTPGNVPVSGEGRRMMWYADKAAFRAGYVDAAQWDKNNIGDYSIAAGYGSTASFFATTALGTYSVASEYASTAIGYGAISSGFGSVSAGFSTTARALGSFATGILNDNSDSPDPYNPSPMDRIFQIGNGANAIRTNAITVLRNGNTGIGDIAPGFPLSFSTGLGDKISLWSNPANSYGFGIQGALLQIHTDIAGADIAFGYGSSASMTETMRIKGNGKVGIGISSPTAPLAFSNTTGAKISLYESSPNSQYGFAVQGAQLQVYSDNAAAKLSFGYYSSGVYTEKMSLDNNTGVLTVNGTNYNSDSRLKKDITPLRNSLQKITGLTGYHYHWKNENDRTGLQTGVLAQEVRQLFPELVTESKDGILAVNYPGLIPVMIESIKEQQQLIKNQQQQIDDLKKMFNELLNRSK